MKYSNLLFKRIAGQNLFWILIFTVLFSGCFKKQDHEIAAPETPVFKLEGILTDSITNVPLENTQVHCQSFLLLHDFILEQPDVTTDSLGHYEYMLTPGNYTLTFFREGLVVAEKNLSMYYRPRQYDAALAKPLISTIRFGLSGIGGIDWLNKDTAIIIQAVPLGENSNSYGIFSGDFASGFEPVGIAVYSEDDPELKGLTIWSKNFWSIGGTFSTPLLYASSQITGKVINSFPLPHRCLDLTSVEETLWLTASNDSLYQLGIPPTQVITRMKIEDLHPSGIAFNGNSFWIGDKKSKFLIALNNNWQISKVFKLFFVNSDGIDTPIDELTYLAFAPNGDLWCASGYYVLKISAQALDGF